MAPLERVNEESPAAGAPGEDEHDESPAPDKVPVAVAGDEPLVATEADKVPETVADEPPAPVAVADEAPVAVANEVAVAVADEAPVTVADDVPVAVADEVSVPGRRVTPAHRERLEKTAVVADGCDGRGRG